jgi:hypothetical protein
MKRIARLVSVLLAICMAWTPFSLHATMIGTEQVVASAQEQDNRDKLIRLVQRTDVATQLETFGISSAAAQERVNAMTPHEIAELAGNIDSLPAGADTTLSLIASTWLIAAIIALIAFVVWYRPRT